MKVNGVLELKKMLWNKKGEFVEGFTEKMLTFALGRGVEYYDGAVVKTISDGSRPSNAANCCRATSTAFRAFAANACQLEGLP